MPLEKKGGMPQMMSLHIWLHCTKMRWLFCEAKQISKLYFQLLQIAYPIRYMVMKLNDVSWMSVFWIM